VIAVEQDQENADGRGEQKQPILREHVGVQHTATVAHADFVLFLLIDAVEGGEVYVGRRLVDVDVVVIGSEDAGRQKGVNMDISLTR
jgi:hypothetical protein